MAAAWLICEIYFKNKDKINKYLSSASLNEDIKKRTRQKIRESLKK